jgi:hypothetical protein
MARPACPRVPSDAGPRIHVIWCDHARHAEHVHGSAWRGGGALIVPMQLAICFQCDRGEYWDSVYRLASPARRGPGQFMLTCIGVVPTCRQRRRQLHAVADHDMTSTTACLVLLCRPVQFREPHPPPTQTHVSLFAPQVHRITYKESGF